MYSPIKCLHISNTISFSGNNPTETQENALQPTACHFLIYSADVTAT